jgi:hypothetical protein
MEQFSMENMRQLSVNQLYNVALTALNVLEEKLAASSREPEASTSVGGQEARLEGD